MKHMQARLQEEKTLETPEQPRDSINLIEHQMYKQGDPQPTYAEISVRDGSTPVYIRAQLNQDMTWVDGFYVGVLEPDHGESIKLEINRVWCSPGSSTSQNAAWNYIGHCEVRLIQHVDDYDKPIKTTDGSWGGYAKKTTYQYQLHHAYWRLKREEMK